MNEDSSYQIGYTSAEQPAFEHVAVASSGSGLCPAALRPLITVDTVHDGTYIPDELLRSPGVRALVEDGTLWHYYVLERDWGADLVAKHLVRELGLAGFNRITTARLVMDFNRFPGSSPPDATPLDRLAIIHPFARVLGNGEKRSILRSYYDPVSEGMESAISGKLVKISIHTYDSYNPSRTERPEVSLITRSLSYQLNSRLPFGLFDPLFPDVLAESSCNAILRDRLAITLEKAGISVENNYPYCAPDGSLEVRTQPWFYFQRLRQRFEQERSERRDDPAFTRVWAMLLNTNLRNGDAEALRGYLHRFRGAPAGLKQAFRAAAEGYEQLARYTESNPALVDEYRRSPDRPSSISIEVRKDLVFRFVRGEPVEPREENARAIARKAAEGIATYLREDREEFIAQTRCARFDLAPDPSLRGETGL